MPAATPTRSAIAAMLTPRRRVGIGMRDHSAREDRSADSSRSRVTVTSAKPAYCGVGRHAGVPSSHWLSVSCRTFVPSKRMAKMSP